MELFSSPHFLSYIDAMYDLYKKDPASIDKELLYFFQGYEYGVDTKDTLSTSSKLINGAEVADCSAIAHNSGKDTSKYNTRNTSDETPIKRWIVAITKEYYRAFGHARAQTNPMQPLFDRPLPQDASECYPWYSMLCESLDIENELLPTSGLLAKDVATLAEIDSALQERYTKTLSLQYSTSKLHYSSPGSSTGGNAGNNVGNNLKVFDIFESYEPSVAKDDALRALYSVVQTEALESFCQKNFQGKIRFSIEGCESFIPLVKELIEHAALRGAKEVMIGAAHRGRLSLIYEGLGKNHESLFKEFLEIKEGTYRQDATAFDDVKYHKGYSSEIVSRNGNTITTTLLPNPSHLESIDPVLSGACFAAQRNHDCKMSVVPIAVHGDASFAGQGVVYETMQLSQKEGYNTGGTLHIVLNNNVGFTTSPSEGRSMQYASSIASAFNYPVIHINACSVVACIVGARKAIDIRNATKKDVVIILNGWRKYSHNEIDEPRFTQPLYYEYLRSLPTARMAYMKEIARLFSESASSLNKQVLELEGKHAEKLSKIFDDVQSKKEKSCNALQDVENERCIHPTEYANTSGLNRNQQQSTGVCDSICSQQSKDISAKISDEKERIRIQRETGEVEEFSAPRKTGKAGFQEHHTIPDIDTQEDDLTDAGIDMDEGYDQTKEHSDSTDERTTYDDDDDPFSDRNRWRRGILEDPEANDW